MYQAGNTVEQVFGGTVIKQGDRTPLGFNFRTENGELVYLTGSTVQVKVASDKGVVLEKQATISDDYTVQFAIGSQDITGAGDMRIEFIVTYPGGTIEKFPSDDWQRIRITPTLEDVEKYGVGYITFEKLTEEFQNQFNEFKGDAGQQFDEFKGDVEQQIAGQKQRVDNLISSTPQPSEIVDSRYDENGNIFPNLKAHLDDKGNKINEQQKFRTGINLAQLGAKPIEQYPDFDSTPFIQTAIYGVYGELYLPEGTFEVKLDGQTYAGKGTGIALKLRSNLRIYGPGKIRLKSGQSGSCAIMANPGDSIDNCKIDEITVDGNRDNCSGNIANIIMFGATNCRMRDVKSKNSSYVGLMIRGVGTKDNRIEDCKVEDSDYIGIQAQRHEGLHVVNNTVLNSGDNGIDLEGNDSIGGVNNRGFGSQIIVADNKVNNANSGIFIESLGQVLVHGNSVYHTNVAIFVNRIDSGSYWNNIFGNNLINTPWDSGYTYDVGDRVVVGSKLYECTVPGVSTTAPTHTTGTATDGTLTWKWLRNFPSNYGARFNNNVGKGIFTINHIRGFKHGVRCVSSASYLNFKDNYFSNIEKYLFYISTGANSLIKSQIGENTYEGTQVNGFPKTVPPTTESPNYANRIFNVGIKSAFSLENNAPLRDTFYYKTANMDNTRSGWGGAYALYTGGETKIYVPGGGIVVGDYLKINGTFYYVQANSGGEITVRNSSQVAGDYTAALNGSYVVYSHSPSEYSALLVD